MNNPSVQHLIKTLGPSNVRINITRPISTLTNDVRSFDHGFDCFSETHKNLTNEVLESVVTTVQAVQAVPTLPSHVQQNTRPDVQSYTRASNTLSVTHQPIYIKYNKNEFKVSDDIRYAQVKSSSVLNGSISTKINKIKHLDVESYFRVFVNKQDIGVCESHHSLQALFGSYVSNHVEEEAILKKLKIEELRIFAAFFDIDIRDPEEGKIINKKNLIDAVNKKIETYKAI